MWGEILQLLIALPVAAALLFLVPRHASRAWAIWLLICLIAVSLEGVGQEIFNYYYPDRLSLFTKENELEFHRDKAGEVVSVVVNNPPEGCRASRFHQPPVIVAAGALLLAFAILLLLLRAEPLAPSSTIAAKSPGRCTGLSIQAFGLVVLLASMAEAIAVRGATLNLLGVAAIASGYYVSRGSQFAAKWALALMALIGLLVLIFVVLIAAGQNVGILGRELEPSETRWAIMIGAAATAWAAVNLYLTFRFLTRPESSAGPTSGQSD